MILYSNKEIFLVKKSDINLICFMRVLGRLRGKGYSYGYLVYMIY